ncbi:hypothetical protein LWE61_04270 [Sphingobium sufflavum]|uniref:hypothetical protein n=1 Tax=Sphingobium sufflavum TaxID=1129547 RepID=UPI001F3446A2|nr:hypothetical protein [Sphingobium sufflavum]MCE7795771.1 hypothetical protein [Sphingobium sufflavum]
MPSLLPTRLALSLANRVPDYARLTRSSVALIATILVHLLLLLILLLSRGQPVVKQEERDLMTFSVTPDPAKKDAGAKTKQPEKKAALQAAAPPAVKPVVTPDPPPQVAAPSIIPMTRDAFAASNIANLPSHGKSAGSAGAGSDSALASGPGQGPGGVQLYEAEWYRRPSDMELAGYLPAERPPNGWGLVACKTVENFHVENCQSLGESPPGSGFARAVRQAAWQFLVRPPRIDGRAQVGAWVRIRIDYSQRERTGPE